MQDIADILSLYLYKSFFLIMYYFHHYLLLTSFQLFHFFVFSCRTLHPPLWDCEQQKSRFFLSMFVCSFVCLFVCLYICSFVFMSVRLFVLVCQIRSQIFMEICTSERLRPKHWDSTRLKTQKLESQSIESQKFETQNRKIEKFKNWSSKMNTVYHSSAWLCLMTNLVIKTLLGKQDITL